MTDTNDTHIRLESFWPYQVIVLADQISRYTLEVVRAEAGINQSQWRVLAAIADGPGRTAADVTAVTPLDKTIVSRAVNSLIEQSLVVKLPSKDDKRSAYLETTPHGRACYRKISSKLTKNMMPIGAGETSPEDFVLILKEFSAHMKTVNKSK